MTLIPSIKQASGFRYFRFEIHVCHCHFSLVFRYLYMFSTIQLLGPSKITCFCMQIPKSILLFFRSILGRGVGKEPRSVAWHFVPCMVGVAKMRRNYTSSSQNVSYWIP